MSIEPGPPRLRPDQLMVAKLFEIADRLADQGALGHLTTKTITVGTEWTEIVGAWLACDLYVDPGSSDVYVRLITEESGDLSERPWETGEAPLRAGEHLPIRLGARTYMRRQVLTLEGMQEEVIQASPSVWMICQAGTATVRVFKLS
jgi:hypothetical protein